MYVISCAGLRFVRSIVNVHVYSVEKILIVLIFYFAPSINLNNIIRQEKSIMCNRHIQINHILLRINKRIGHKLLQH